MPGTSARSWVLRCALVAVAIIAPAASDLVAGGGGASARFRQWPMRDTLSLLWKNTPSGNTGVTVEMWYRPLDLRTYWQYGFTYSVQGPPFSVSELEQGWCVFCMPLLGFAKVKLGA